MLLGVVRLIVNHRPFPPSQAHQKWGSFPPPALPGLNGHITLSDSQTGRRPFGPRLEARPPPAPGTPHSLRSPSLHAVLTTPVDRNRCLLVPSLSARPSPFFRRVGIHIVTFEACSSFTRVTPAQLLAHHTWALSRGSALAGFPARTLASYQVLPTTT